MYFHTNEQGHGDIIAETGVKMCIWLDSPWWTWSGPHPLCPHCGIISPREGGLTMYVAVTHQTKKNQRAQWELRRKKKMVFLSWTRPSPAQQKACIHKYKSNEIFHLYLYLYLYLYLIILAFTDQKASITTPNTKALLLSPYLLRTKRSSPRTDSSSTILEFYSALVPKPSTMPRQLSKHGGEVTHLSFLLSLLTLASSFCLISDLFYLQALGSELVICRPQDFDWGRDQVLYLRQGASSLGHATPSGLLCC